MYERFTDRARKVMQLANEEAKRFNHEYVGTEHILLGLIKHGSGVAANVLRNLDVDLHKAREETEKIVRAGQDDFVPMSKLPQTPRAKKVIEYAIEESRNLNHNYVGTEHLLLGLLREQEGVGAQVLLNLNLKLEEVREEVLNLLGHGMDAGGEVERTAPKEVKSKTPALDSFGRDLTELARQDKLDPVIGREREIERIITILGQRDRFNPLLVGQPGVGKTAIVDRLAQMIVDGDVSELIGQRIVMLDVAMMFAGTKYRGQFEERIKAVINELRRCGNTLLLIENLHALIEPDGAEWAIDASTILKPALASGEIRFIATTTLDGYRERILKDGLLERRLQAVTVDPPSSETTRAILHALRDRYEDHHGVEITDQALEAAVELSCLFLPEQNLPVKAIQLVDEASSGLRNKATVRPPDVKQIEQEIDRLNREKEEAVAHQNFELAGSLRDQADALKKQRASFAEEWRKRSKTVGVTVDQTVIVELISRHAGVPVDEVEKRDSSSLRRRPGSLHTRLPEFERLQAESILRGQGIQITQGSGYVMLPHRPEFAAIYREVILPTMRAHLAEVKRAEDIYQPGSILSQVWAQIRTAEVIVADVSGNNPDVIFGLGLCFGLHRCPILLVHDPSELPPNLRGLNYLPYESSVEGLGRFRNDLSRAIEDFLSTSRASRTEP